ncbi:MAG: RNA polymerase sporulation sigma factor SigF [Lachnospira sp.]|nr:RNA polymerase sporulation sigma factor SigF [Lachnospira sp.]
MDHTKELIERAHNGDKDAREQLVLENMGLIWSIVRRFAGRGYEQEDLFQIGSIGLIKAIDKFDMAFDVRFSTYAVPMIAGEIKRFLRDDGMIKVSRSLKEIAYKAYLAKEQMEKEMKREPTLKEIAAVIEVSEEDLIQAMDASAEIESLHKIIYQGDGSDISLMDKLQQEGDVSEDITNRLMVEQMLNCLESKEKQIIYMRYYLDKTQTEIATELGVSQVQVSRMEKKILQKMARMCG